jgi:hypothetical protein
VLLLIEKFQQSKVTFEGQHSLVVQYYRDIGSGHDSPLVLLADRTNLQSIIHAPILMFDGTFGYRPAEFAQTYTMHAVFPDLPDNQSSFLCGKRFV